MQGSLGLERSARFGVACRDATAAATDGPQPGGLTGVIATLTKLTAEERQRLGDRVLDRPLA